MVADVRRATGWLLRQPSCRQYTCSVSESVRCAPVWTAAADVGVLFLVRLLAVCACVPASLDALQVSHRVTILCVSIACARRERCSRERPVVRTRVRIVCAVCPVCAASATRCSLSALTVRFTLTADARRNVSLCWFLPRVQTLFARAFAATLIAGRLLVWQRNDLCVLCCLHSFGTAAWQCRVARYRSVFQ